MAEAKHRSKELLRGIAAYALFALAILIGIVLAFLSPQKSSKHALGVGIGAEANADVVTSGGTGNPDDGDGGCTSA